MTALFHDLPALSGAFLASMVEAVEALTVILAVAATRGVRPALQGTLLGLGFLAGIVAAFGPVLSIIPVFLLQGVVGAFALWFGARWLRKAVLRAAGRIPLHDEAKIFSQATASLAAERATERQRLDWLGLVTTFKIVLLEGFEVVLVVLALAAGGGQMAIASLGAGLAVLLVALLGVALHRPLTRVPENSLKMAVGIMMSAFGLFWVGEAFKMPWPGDDWSLVGLMAGIGGVAAAAVTIVRKAQTHG